MSPAQRYLRLGLRLGRHDDGVVDAYFGPPDIAAEVDAEPLVDRRTLVIHADELLADLDDGWLRDQVTALRASAAGDPAPYADEVEASFGVRPEHTDEARFADAHRRLDALLPGPGTLAERYAAWRDATRVPPERVEATVAEVLRIARALTGDLVALPGGESVVLETVREVPWIAYNFYLGDLRGRIAVNADLPMCALDLLNTALHEGYPGHQAERALKEHLLVRGEGRLEETIVLAPTPQSLIAEGIAKLGPSILLDGPGGPALAAAVGLDLDLARAVDRAVEPLQWAEVNAALMIHEAGATAAEARAYLERWELLDPELAAHVVRFVTAPASRAYITAYPAGLARCRAFVGRDPARFRRLLTEQVRVAEL